MEAFLEFLILITLLLIATVCIHTSLFLVWLGIALILAEIIFYFILFSQEKVSK